MLCKPYDNDLRSVLDSNVILNIESFLHAVAYLEIVVEQKVWKESILNVNAILAVMNTT